MTEQVNSAATQPIQDKAPKPPGLMPKNVQTWVMLGLAVLMVTIMWLTGGKKAQTAPEARDARCSDSGSARSQRGKDRRATEPDSGASARAAGCTESAEQVVQHAPVRKPGRLASSNQQSTGSNDSANRSNSGRTEETSLPVSVLFQRGPELQEGTCKAGSESEAPPTTNPFGLPSLPAQETDFNQQLAKILQGLPPMPQPIPVPSSATGNARATGMTSAEETEKSASESSSKQASVNPSALNAAEGKNYVLFEGTILGDRPFESTRRAIHWTLSSASLPTTSTRTTANTF